MIPSCSSIDEISLILGLGRDLQETGNLLVIMSDIVNKLTSVFYASVLLLMTSICFLQ